MHWHARDYLDLLTFKPVSRPMFVELFGPLIGLDQEWKDQGATPEELDLTAFDFDRVEFCPAGGQCGPIAAPPVTLSETAEELVQRDYLGRTTRLIKKTATLPLPMDFPVKTMDDWLKLKPLFTWDPSRIDARQIERAIARREAGAVIRAGIPGAFDTPRELMGEEVACMAYYDQPELMHDILQTLSDTSFRVLEEVSRHVTIDCLWVHEDLAGRSGPLVGPAQVREFFRPYYRRIWDLLRERGARVFDQDTDGNANPILDDLVDAGLTSIYPNEPAAGMDIVAIRRKFGPRLALRGGIDKHVLRRTKAEIRAELEYKLRPDMWTGTVFGLDHRIPNGTPLDNYRYYVDTAREILGLPARGNAGTSNRMA